MAFVNATPITASVRQATSLGSQFSTTPLRHLSNAKESEPIESHTIAQPVSTPRMGYGKYSYLTDKTKGHVNQYYVDKFRVAADFVKGPPASDADALVGRTAKGGVAVPTDGGILQPGLPPLDTDVVPDPRIAESEGATYPWDPEYVDPKFLPSTYADTTSVVVADNAFASFRGSMASDRGLALSTNDFAHADRVQRIQAGIDETYLLTLDGQLDINYARAEKISYPPGLNPTGRPQTEIPGFPFTPSVGALDFIEQPEASVAFWKQGDNNSTPTYYKKPSGNETPELPYNTASTVEKLIEAQEARGILPQAE